MSAALDAFLTAILPIFAVPALGYALGRGGAFDLAGARAVNQTVMLIFLPALVVGMLAGVDWSTIAFATLAAYAVSELILCVLVTWIARRFFEASFEEALLLGMLACFANHVFFVLPIAVTLYGVEEAAAVAAIIAIDSVGLFAAVMITLDIRRGGGSVGGTVASLAKNPMIIAIAIGQTLNLLGAQLPQGLTTYLDFAGAAAAPGALLALGIVLSQQGLLPISGAALFVTAVKLIAHPLILLGLLTGFAAATAGAQVALLVAAGPCGAMPFVLALRYGVETRRITAAIVYSTVLSLITLSIVA